MSKTNGNQQQQQVDLRDVNVKANYDEVDDTWLNYGYRQVPIAATNEKGEYVGPSGTKAILQKGQFDEKQFLRLTMPQKQLFVPHEAVEESIYKIADLEILKERGLTFKEPIIKESHYGNTRYWIIETNIIQAIKGSHEKDDVVGVGFCVRNGYNTNVALGFDMMTMRLICTNGAIARGRDIGTATIKHVGNDAKQLVNLFSDSMIDAMDHAHDLIDLYQSLTKIKMNQKIAEHLYNSIHASDVYFPEYFEIALSKKEKNKEKKEKALEKLKGGPAVTLTADGKSNTLWQTFNDITNPLWHAMEPKTVKTKGGQTTTKQGINFYSVNRFTMDLHRACGMVVSAPKLFAVK